MRNSMDLVWDYSAIRPFAIGGVILTIDFYRGKLARAIAYHRYVWRDKQVVLYHVEAGWMVSSPLLDHYVPCESPRRP
jgi:hypothetical protein